MLTQPFGRIRQIQSSALKKLRHPKLGRKAIEWFNSKDKYISWLDSFTPRKHHQQ